MSTNVDLTPMFPESLVMTGVDQTLRRERVVVSPFRTWRIVPRYGTAESDRWTIIGSPIPALSNPAADYEDGQFSTLQDATEALATAMTCDNGTHESDD